ncbi:MAG TPA: hypothetical protein VG035_00850, partial [Actinomycetota bacterium]|nr:hypothetical protein [Actinomycetota bacterium]
MCRLIRTRTGSPGGQGWAARAAPTGAGGAWGRAVSASRRRRSSSPNPSSIAATPRAATTAHRIPAGEVRASPDPTHSAAATATAISPLSSVVAITPGFRASSPPAPSEAPGGSRMPVMVGRDGRSGPGPGGRGWRRRPAGCS